jgi:hypothetical protein
MAQVATLGVVVLMGVELLSVTANDTGFDYETDVLDCMMNRLSYQARQLTRAMWG